MNNFKEIKKFVISFFKKQRKTSKDFIDTNNDDYEQLVQKFLEDFKKSFLSKRFKRKKSEQKKK